MLLLLFLVLMIVTFSAVMYVTKPSKKETELNRRLAEFDRASVIDPLGTDDIRKREVYSEIPAVNAFLQQFKFSAALNTLIKQANSNWTVAQVLFATVAAFVIAALVSSFWLQNIILEVIVSVAAALCPYIPLFVKKRARLRSFQAILPEAIDLMSRALRAGHAVSASIQMVGKEIPDPVGAEFRRVFEEQNFGLPIREALLNLAKRVPLADLHFLVTAMLVQKETGGNLAEVLDKAGVVIRERSRLLGQLRIYTAQGRMTGWILGLLPFVVFLIMSFFDPKYTKSLIDDPVGRKAIWIGLGLMLIGAWMIRKIVDIKV